MSVTHKICSINCLKSAEKNVLYSRSLQLISAGLMPSMDARPNLYASWSKLSTVPATVASSTISTDVVLPGDVGGGEGGGSGGSEGGGSNGGGRGGG